MGRVDLGAYEANSLADAGAGTIPETLTFTAAYQLRDNTTWYAVDCGVLIATITGNGSSPVSGNTTVTVGKDATLLPGTVSHFYEIIPANNPGTTTGSITLYHTRRNLLLTILLIPRVSNSCFLIRTMRR